MNAGLLNTYAAGTTTPQATYTTSAGNVANANPIVLGVDGRPSGEIWFSSGLAYKFILTDSLSNPVGPTLDNLTGINDPTAGAGSVTQWQAGTTPTFINGTTFTLVGNQISTYTINRRCQFTISNSTIVYGRVLTSVYTSLTTITMIMDGLQVLDSGLSIFNYSILSADNQSLPYRIGTSSGTDIYTVNVGLVQYNIGDEYRVKIANSNVTTTPTISFDGLAAKNITRADGTAVTIGDLNGEHIFRYNGTNMLILNPTFRSIIINAANAAAFVFANKNLS